MRQSIAFFAALSLCVLALAYQAVFGAIDSKTVSTGDTIAYAQVRPVFKDRCSHCHRGPTDWTQYEIAHRRALTIRTRVAVFKNMPPMASEITDDERDLIKRWVDGGAKE